MLFFYLVEAQEFISSLAALFHVSLTCPNAFLLSMTLESRFIRVRGLQSSSVALESGSIEWRSGSSILHSVSLFSDHSSIDSPPKTTSRSAFNLGLLNTALRHFS